MGDNCSRIFNVSDTVVNTLHIVMQSHANPLGILHGGNMIRWLVDAGTLAASKVVVGYPLLAGIDFIYLGKPVGVGETIAVFAWSPYAGRSSVEVGLAAYSLGRPGGQGLERVSAAHMTFVNVKPHEGVLRPHPHGSCIEAVDREEERLLEASMKMREARVERLRGRELLRQTVYSLRESGTEPFEVESYRIVNPIDSVAYDVMHAGAMLYIVDELGAVAALRSSAGIVVTGFVGPADFVAPMRVGEVLRMWARTSYVGRSSVEVLIRSASGFMGGGEARLTSEAYLTYISLDSSGRPLEINAPRGWEPEEQALRRAEWRRRLIRSIDSGETALEPPRRFLEMLMRGRVG
ncbi:acyl coenzyme A thioester hydrolase [Aeropyrum pernix K1]|uniref:Acyl coenzyme A thioester hydrolase n=1 Tax=Aeropyrum pernix (strain ATCC 700893 / DSM 11879 / JCM 9820 / NBRC 100138 / K1) TaxID=272557 RepID=Q9YF99_AERPE|nr:acyl-CoA thioesterase [Aeropyrum pernix]BAA79297.2 acyl coenzyme A thioester hydrolase [Aeropyrum pernix K1]